MVKHEFAFLKLLIFDLVFPSAAALLQDVNERLEFELRSPDERSRNVKQELGLVDHLLS